MTSHFLILVGLLVGSGCTITRYYDCGLDAAREGR